MKSQDIDAELSRCVNQLLLKEPFFAHILSGTVRNISDKLPTAAVGIREGQILLMVNPEFFLKELRSTSQRIAVLKHETLHLVFKHLFRDLIKKDPELMNLAADIVVNQYIGSWDLPDSAVTLNTFPDLKLSQGETMEYYYKRLEEMKKLSEQNNGSNEGNKEGTNSKSLENFKNIYGKQRHSDHSEWMNESEADNPGLKEALENQLLNAASRTSARQYGSLPGEVQRMINQIRESRKPRVDWKRQLRLFASSHGKTYVSHTMKRISKRYGTRPGIRIKRSNHIIVVIDTSGSIDESTLELFMSEIAGIKRAGAELTIIEADAAVQNCYPYKKGINLSCKGGGGTNFNPAFEYINSGKAGVADGCIYLTDGQAPEPTIKPRTALLWILTPDGNNGEHLRWGRRVVVK